MNEAAGWEAGVSGSGVDRLFPLEPGRVLPPVAGRLLLLLLVLGRLHPLSWDAAPLRSVVTVGFWPGEAPLDFGWRGASEHSLPLGSPLPVGSSGGARPARLVRGTVTWTSMWMLAGRGRCPVPEGVHHGLVDPTRELKLLRSPSRGTPSGNSRSGEVERLGGAKGTGTEPGSFTSPKPPVLPRLSVMPSLMLPPSLRLLSRLLLWLFPWGLVGVVSWVPSSGACVGLW